MPVYEVLLKQVDPLLVASVREFIPLGDDLRQPCRKVAAYLDQQRVQHALPDMLLLHSRHKLHDDRWEIDVEAAIPLPTALEGDEHITIQTLPGGLMAYTIHTGADLFLGQAHAALYRWMKDSGYQLISPPRLVYLQCGEHLDPNQYVTEVQFPITRLLTNAPL